MKLLFKILKLLAILIVSITILLFSASLLLQDKIGGLILKSLNKNISTKLEIRSFKLSFLRKFPKASLELKDVYVHSSPDFNSSDFVGINTDTLLTARSVSVEFSIIGLLKGIYNIERLSAREGRLNFFTDKTGKVNYNITAKSKIEGVNDFTLNLERINLTGLKAKYYNRSAGLILNGEIKDARIKSRISGNNIDFTTGAKIRFDHLQLNNYKIVPPLTADLDLTLQSTKKGVLFKKGMLRIDDYDIGLTGSVSSDKFIDLTISSNNFDIAGIGNYLPEKYLKLLSDYHPTGILSVNSKIYGVLNRTSNPHIEIDFLLNKGSITFRKSDITIKNLSFAGNFSNGSGNKPLTSVLSIREFKSKLGSAEYTGSFTLTGLSDPFVKLQLKGKVFPGELREFFNLQNFSEASGSADLDLRIENKLSHKANYTLADIIDLKPHADLVFYSLTLGLKDKKMVFEEMNGNVLVSNTVISKNFRVRYRGEDIKIDGEFRNFPEWLSGRKVLMSGAGNVTFNKFLPELFFSSDPYSDKPPESLTAINLPGDIMLDFKFKIDNFIYKLFTSTNATGSFNYKPKILTFKSLKMESSNGMISGDCYISQNNNKSFIAKGTFNVNNVDVNKAFTSFHNFGQDFLKAENIEGRLTGSLSLLLPMDSMMNAQIKYVTAEGKYLLVNGTLMNFDPVKQLSSFIELSELENIRFEQMENDFFIRNNFLYIPQMDVKSSAVNLTVNGRHSFDNDYEYHVKLLLSEILSRKRQKLKTNVTDFGTIEDDGLGRTSILLKLVGKGEEVKVSYDVKAAGTELKNNIKNERQTLKGILNQEYGWFKNDTTVKKKPAEKKAVEKKSRFRITWDESDTLKNQF